MHQRHPIRIDKGRTFPASNRPAVSSSTQGGSFHKIYRKKRCYSLVDKEQEGRGSSQWKAGHVIPQRDNNAGLQSNISSGPSSLKPSQRVDSMRSNNYGSQSVSPPNREIVRNHRQHLKRSNDRLGFNLVSGPEFDVPFVKKQKVENYKSSALRCNITPEGGQDKQKMVSDDTKWMYKNQHAKMSGPYGVGQLMEGFYARFLQEDLPVYQFHEGKLGRPIMLKQLIDELESCSSLMHSPPRHFDETFCEEGFRHAAPPCEIVEDMDLPPGFGGQSAQLSERPSSIHMHKSAAAAATLKRSVGAFSSSLPDSGAAEFGLPPGFEVLASTASLTEPFITELQGSSRKLPTCAGMAVWSEGAEGMQSSYEKFEPVVQGRGHSSHQGSSPYPKGSFTMQGVKSLSGNPTQLEPVVHGRGHLCQQDSSPSKVNFTLQGARSLNGNSSRHTTWAFSPPNTRVSNIEAQTFSSPTVCIGLPVSKPAVQNWPVGNNLPMAYAQAANNGLLSKEYSEFSVMHGVTPLDLIHSELLTAVKRSYAKTVLSALIDEHLKCWIHGKATMVKSLLPEDGNRCREAPSLSSAEFGVVCVESNTLQTGASTSLAKQHIGSEETSLQVHAVHSSDGSCLDAHVGSAEIFAEPGVAQCFDGSGLNNQSIHTEEHQCLSVGTFSSRNTFAMTDVRSPIDTKQNTVDINKAPFQKKSVEIDLGKADSFLSCDEASNLSFKSSSLSGNIVDNLKQVVVDQREEMQHQSRETILQEEGLFAGKVQSSGSTSDAVYLETDAVYLETEPSFLVSGKKKWKIKSLKCLMQITSKLRPRHTKISPSSISKKEEMSMGMVPEKLVQNGVPIPKDYDGCARTSVDGWVWRKLARRAPYSESFLKGCSNFCTQSNAPTHQRHHTQCRNFSAAADCSFIPKLTRSEAKLKLARSKIHEWGIFAVEPVEAGDFVIEYVGEVVRPRVSDIRERHYKNLGIGCSFLFHVDDEMVVDATKRGGFARFMNYSCDPNCYTKIVTLEGSKKVYIYAKRHIISGEELTYDCKLQLEDQKIPCNCGFARCRDFQIDTCK